MGSDPGITITVTNSWRPDWLTREEAEEMSDEHIIECALEDMSEALHGATWTIERDDD